MKKVVWKKELKNLEKIVIDFLNFKVPYFCKAHFNENDIMIIGHLHYYKPLKRRVK